MIQASPVNYFIIHFSRDFCVSFPRLTCKKMAALRTKIMRIVAKYDSQINARLPPVGQRFWNHEAGICAECVCLFCAHYFIKFHIFFMSTSQPRNERCFIIITHDHGILVSFQFYIKIDYTLHNFSDFIYSNRNCVGIRT